jgi:hypothetical protein
MSDPEALAWQGLDLDADSPDLAIVLAIRWHIASFCRETHKPFSYLGLHASVASSLQGGVFAPGLSLSRELCLSRARRDLGVSLIGSSKW